ncbi:hypothetical protein [Eisenbergiella tayi]|uniref:rolling circle replication-associated protein n=1 Tax=Eisenbergiella tayi TaxID=1432052 RepID=UPI0008485A48|nr:hypothetical protein [Eisenbergiella tayi]ODR41303.1 hypothetical protein BEI60_06335 [Eisenbergiella tayi]
MAYTKKTYRLKTAIEVEEYHSAKYGAPGLSRVPKKKLTPEQMERQNQANREKTVRRKLREHFQPNDYFSDLTYRKEERPADMKMAKVHFKKFIRQVRNAYRKRGQELKWIRNIEVGTKNGWHIHVVINRIPDTDVILQESWPYGKVVNTLMYEKGGFADLAAYLTKTPATDPRLRESDYSASRNLPLPEPEEKIYYRWKTWKEIKVPPGYYLDKPSVKEGENPFTGYRYRSYTLLPLPGWKREKQEGKRKGKRERQRQKEGLRLRSREQKEAYRQELSPSNGGGTCQNPKEGRGMEHGKTSL